MSAPEITITIPVSEAASRHIEDLQAIITKRNAQIAAPTARVEEAETGEPNQVALNKAYRRGWQEAAQHLMKVTRDTAQALSRVHKSAWDVYLSGESGDNSKAEVES